MHNSLRHDAPPGAAKHSRETKKKSSELVIGADKAKMSLSFTKNRMIMAQDDTLGDNNVEISHHQPRVLLVERKRHDTPPTVDLSQSSDHSDHVRPMSPAATYSMGVELTYSVDSDSFPTTKHKNLAMDALEKASESYNGLGLGVTIKHVTEGKPAVFQLVYRDATVRGERNVYAKSFFPSSGRAKRNLVVYALSLEPFFSEEYTRKNLVEVFHHELGHVFGLRHERADKDEKDKSVLFGSENSGSVMNSYTPDKLSMHESDKKGLKELYEYNESYFREMPVVKVVPEPSLASKAKWSLWSQQMFGKTTNSKRAVPRGE
ncbi:hypothetical protein GQ53DRAFT_758865 [Thozetella sp. PMI_491]|nr:hypothetical protein GQ53DRAFT_758865 [Thozetella sp. PMI_491]